MSYNSEIALIDNMAHSGSIILTDGEQYTAKAVKRIKAITESLVTIAALKGDSIDTLTIPIGFTIEGRFSSVIVTTGDVICYTELNNIEHNYVLFNGLQVFYNGKPVIYSGV